MNLWIKTAIVFLCAAICALSVTLIPRGESKSRSRPQTTPVKLPESARGDWLLV